MVETGPTWRSEAASRTLLDLVAELMDASFDALGEGVILGTMPTFLERSARKTAQRFGDRYVACDPRRGAVSALTSMNVVSRATGTDFTMVTARKDQAVKRLHSCEFQPSFAQKGEFPKAMICMLHKAIYQGHVNGLLEHPQEEGYNVSVQSRILFGDEGCDFLVESRPERPAEPDDECPVRDTPDAQTTEHLNVSTYTAILTAFTEYLTAVLPEDRVKKILKDCSERIGKRLGNVLLAGDHLEKQTATGMVEAVLRTGGRRLESTESSVLVSSCPQAQPIMDASAHLGQSMCHQVRSNACRLCVGIVQGATGTIDDSLVETQTTLTTGGEGCPFALSREGKP